ncbi:hypothetical protein B6U67_04185 [Methanosarcinales archaeon ex4484_138]|nr:MAG: hypothetical protein B6U67_04185 [Methanosarcinales archaeon ex4484_138]
MTLVTLTVPENERILMKLLYDEGLTDKQVRAGMKYYRNLLSKFTKYQKHPEKAVVPIIRNIEGMKEALS